jgi:hypothetical protein
MYTNSAEINIKTGKFENHTFSQSFKYLNNGIISLLCVCGFIFRGVA